MSSNINLIAFGTFGNPNGFTQTFFAGNSNLAKSIRTFDINTSALNLFPNSKVYSIRKELANGCNAIAYSIYTYAREQNSTRGGTFIGSSILLIDKIAEENIIINCLNEFHSNLKNKNVQNDVIKVTHSNDFSVSRPKDFDKINARLREIGNPDFARTTNRQLVVYCETNPNQLQLIFKKAVDLLDVYDTIYFTENSEVAEFVHQKRIFQLVRKDGFEAEIQKLEEERQRKIQTALDEFARERERLEEDRKRAIEEYKNQIEQNERLHLENERRIKESKNELNCIGQNYEAFSKNIEESISRLKKGEKLESIRQLYNENKRIFIDSIYNQKKAEFLRTIPKYGIKTELKVEKPIHSGQKQYESDSHSYDHSQPKRKAYKINIFKVATIVLSLMWIGTLIYFLFFHTSEDSIKNQLQELPQQQVQIEITDSKAIIPELNPVPNVELNENDYRNVAKNLNYNIKIDEVVKIIFDKNPTDIKGTYTGQEENYGKHIIDLNKDCFEEREEVYFFVKDTLRHIPSYKYNNL